MEKWKEIREEELILRKIKSQKEEELRNLITDLITEKINKEEDPEKLYQFFSYIYDDIYHDLLFKKIKIDKKITKVLEMLATPIHEKSKEEQAKLKSYILNKIS